MIENKNVKKILNDNSKVYCQEDYAQELYNMYMGNNMAVVSKDIVNGEIFQVTDFRVGNNGEIEATCENSITLYFDPSKEKKYLELLGMNETTFRHWILSNSHKEYLKEKKIFIYVECNKNRRGSMYAAHLTTIVHEFKEQVENPTSAYVAKVLNKNQGGFIVEVQGVKAFLPGSLAAANKITNFESYIGKEVTVMIEDYLQPSGIFVVSYKKYLDNILPSKLASLERNQLMKGTVTGTSKFGIFIEFDEIFTGLLHKSEMNEDTNSRFITRTVRSGEEIEVWLKDIRDNKLILTEQDPSILQNEMEEFKDKVEGEFIDASIVSIKSHGALMELSEGKLGLLPVKEMKKTGKRLHIGETLEVYVKRVDSESGKIYLTHQDEEVST
jgi:ribosomal protein S1